MASTAAWKTSVLAKRKFLRGKYYELRLHNRRLGAIPNPVGPFVAGHVDPFVPVEGDDFDDMEDKPAHPGVYADDDAVDFDPSMCMRLDLSLNSLYNVRGLRTFVQVRIVRLDNNQLESLDGLQSLEHLQSLHAAQNIIQDVSALRGLTNLVRLNLSFNELDSLDALAPVGSLRMLEVEGNLLKSLDGLQGMHHLEVLHARGNRIASIAAVAGLQALRELDVSCNRVTDVLATSRTVHTLPSLVSLVIHGNPLCDEKGKSHEKHFLQMGKLAELDHLPVDKAAVAEAPVLARQELVDRAMTVTRESYEERIRREEAEIERQLDELAAAENEHHQKLARVDLEREEDRERTIQYLMDLAEHD